ncbi:MAG: 16S rRNA methyltransferase, partial [Anaerolineae bacterium]|nr:hypothetical protein [Thermoflexales bacterium]MDW8408334.1 16S rRNA methyltransferase [Anaerolineae bacterium]
MSQSVDSSDFQQQLDQLVEAVRAGVKYRSVNSDFIRRIGARELTIRRSLKEAVPAVRNKLHQVAGAYLARPPRYARWLQELRAAHDSAQVRQVCARLMSSHASTQERLPILDRFYRVLLADMPPLRRVADLACGLNPLSIPWMNLPADMEYHAVDIYDDMMAFMQAFFALSGINGVAESRDILADLPTGHFDIVFLFKALPCLEQVDKQAAAHLLEAIDADRLIVSFPVHSLGGRDKGMSAHYEGHLRRLVT